MSLFVPMAYVAAAPEEEGGYAIDAHTSARCFVLFGGNANAFYIRSPSIDKKWGRAGRDRDLSSPYTLLRHSRMVRKEEM